MISGFIHFLQSVLNGSINGSLNGMHAILLVIAASTGIGLFFMIFRFIKSFNIFN